MKGHGRVVLGSIAGGLLGATAFFTVDALMPAHADAQYLNSAGGNIYGDSNFNPMADPDFNPMADPDFNPNADPSFNPCGEYGC